jgi:GrpB-like predicted nucleotidyltransferase (UPF0157 family)
VAGWAVHGIDGLGLDSHSLDLQHTPPAWLELGRNLAQQVAGLLGDHAIAVEHIGSTAVPGMLAKPIIDLAAGVVALPDMADILRRLTRSGWTYRNDAGDEGGHVFVLERRPSFRLAHLHIVEHCGDQWRRYLALRERLRSDPSARDAYESVKRTLSAQLGDNRRGEYTQGKSMIVDALTGDVDPG